MRKIIIAVSIIVLAVGALGLTACGGGDQDPAVVGTWEWDFFPDHFYTFNADGSGSRGGVPGIADETFTWSTSGDRLNIRRDTVGSGEIRNERWTYSISGGSLTIESQQEAGLIFVLDRR